jgi:arylsulfatase A-like enzyme
MDGVSLRPFLHGETPDKWRDCVHIEMDFAQPHKATVHQEAAGTSFHESNLAILREAQFKLVHFNGGLPSVLFDLAADPGELVNLADDPAHAATLLRLTQKLLSLRMRHADRRLSDMRIGAGGVVQFQN